MNEVATHSSRYARSLIEASHDPLITISTRGKIMDMNEATVRMTGLARAKLMGTDFFDYFTDPDKAREVYREIFSQGFVADYPLTMSQGEFTEVLFNGSVYKNESGQVLGAVVVARDITGQKKTEKELTEAIIFAELAADIAEQAKARAEEATRVAEEAVRAKQQFLSNMSHEIRTPMNAIIGFTRVMLRSVQEEKQKEYLNAIRQSGEALLVLINDILDLAKVDAGKMTFEDTPFHLPASVSAMLQLFEHTFLEKNVALDFRYDKKIPEVVSGDPVRLRQIILNLVSNAVKFTESGAVTLTVAMLSENENKVEVNISVEDTGIGIEKEKLEGIFESFQQASKGTSRLYGGTGLGLAIVKKLVEAQGGNMIVKSEPGKGSSFSFTLTFQKTGTVLGEEKVHARSEVATGQIKVLVVEDIPLNQLLLKTILNDFGFESDYAANGRIAVDLISLNERSDSAPYDIILMDLQMPVMDGFEATEHIRKVLESDIPILALSADVTTVDLKKCRAAGMNDYITKPVDEEELEDKILRLVRSSTGGRAIKVPRPEAVNSDKVVDLKQLHARTKGDPALKAEIIKLYLAQTPELLSTMVSALKKHDLPSLKSVVHKMIPSFSILGLKSNPENLARKILLCVSTKEHDAVHGLVIQLEDICRRSCEALKQHLSIIESEK